MNDSFSQSRAERDAPAALAASIAAQAQAKAGNAAHTPGPLELRNEFGMQSLIYPVGAEYPAAAVTGYYSRLGQSEPNARRIVACWNACIGVPTETLESAAGWADIVKTPLAHRQCIPAEAAQIGAALDGDSLEQGDHP